MKVSFVVPVYKKKPEQFKKCLKSLQGQSHKDIEVVCVFDGPNEELESVVKLVELEDKRFSHIVIEHGGAPKARNAGFPLTKGDVVSFWDADCYAEPEMTAMWIRTFDDNPDCDFVYSGYRFVQPEVPGYESELFDPWVLARYNYISSMFPLRRDKFPGWDESLEGLQDWDYWRRVVENGSKGRFIPGFGWATELPDKESISGNVETTRQRIEKVREKHGDAKKDILVYGGLYKREAIHFAKILDADYFVNPFWRINDYKAVLMVGFHPWEIRDAGGLFSSLKEDTVKMVYWMGLDSEMFYNAPYFEVKQLVAKINQTINHHFCDGERTRKILADMGINAEIMPFPREGGVAQETLPDKFRVLAVSDEAFKGHLHAVVKSMPDIDFTIVEPEKPYDIKLYTVGMQFTSYPRLLQQSQKMLMNGRYVISNIQEPHAGFVDTSDVTKFKEAVIEKVLSLKKVTEINADAKKYYMEMSDPGIFSKEIKKRYAPTLEVVR
ncbi:MAG TPA: glycosyltransferase [Leptospiraceae bacterium]|nr:glycosyltransferase [Leptospiraceae bacterium]